LKQNKNVDTHLVEQAKQLGPLDNFVCACISGCGLVIVTNPIWLIKTRMQLQLRRSKLEKGFSNPYSSIYDAFRTIVTEEGVLALYKGSVPAMLLSVHGGIQFVCYEFLKECFGSYHKSTKSKNKTMRKYFEESFGYLMMGAVSKM